MLLLRSYLSGMKLWAMNDSDANNSFFSNYQTIIVYNDVLLANYENDSIYYLIYAFL